MTTLWSTTLTLFLALLYCVACKGQSADDPCKHKHHEVEECIKRGSVSLEHLSDPSYGQHMCTENQAVQECLEQHKQDCPKIVSFRGKKGRAVRKYLSSLKKLCNGGKKKGKSGKCRGVVGIFTSKLLKCHEPLEMNLKEDQMCEPLVNVSKCMVKQQKKFRGCDWMTDDIEQQVKFAADYFAAIGAVGYNC